MEFSKDSLPKYPVSYKVHCNDQGGGKRRSCHSVKVLVEIMRITVELRSVRISDLDAGHGNAEGCDDVGSQIRQRLFFQTLQPGCFGAVPAARLSDLKSEIFHFTNTDFLMFFFK
jgi:hypothetical protein